MPRVLSNKILFKDSNDNTGIISFKQNSFNFTKALNCVNGITSESQLTVKEGASVSTASQITEVETDSLTLQGGSAGTVYLKAPTVLDSYTLLMPPAQGTANDFLMLSGKTGNVGSLAWAAVGESGGGGDSLGQERAWVFGVRKQLWLHCTDPVTDAKIPVNISYSGSSAPSWTGNPKSISVGWPCSNNSINWDQNQSSTYWDFRSKCAFGNGDTSSGLFWFGNDTYENVNGNAANFTPAASDGIVWEYYPNNNGPRQIRYYENGVLKKTFPLLQVPQTSSLLSPHEYRIVRKDRVIRFEIIPFTGSQSTLDNQKLWGTHVILEQTMSEGFNPTGTRWGFCHYGSLSAAHILDFEVRTFD